MRRGACPAIFRASTSNPVIVAGGIGEQLVRTLCAAADELGIPRLTVHSSHRAVALYERVGFEHSGVLLQRDASPGAARDEPDGR
jgi:N-acetylglutamate synthase-like GNAT family acetyltransferase